MSGVRLANVHLSAPTGSEFGLVSLNFLSRNILYKINFEGLSRDSMKLLFIAWRKPSIGRAGHEL